MIGFWMSLEISERERLMVNDFYQKLPGFIGT